MKLNQSTESRLQKASVKTGKSVEVLVSSAVDLYLEELEDYFDIQKRKNERAITLDQLKAEIGLGN